MSENDIRSMILDIEKEVSQEISNSLTLEERLAIEIIAIEKRFYYSSGVVQRKKEIRDVLDKALREK